MYAWRCKCSDSRITPSQSKIRAWREEEEEAETETESRLREEEVERCLGLLKRKMVVWESRKEQEEEEGERGIVHAMAGWLGLLVEFGLGSCGFGLSS